MAAQVESADRLTQHFPALLAEVDYVLLETNDGRPHLEQALEVMRAGKPVFIDKPVAGSLEDAVCIYEAAQHYKVPVFSSSSLRFMEDAQKARNGSCGKILGCDTFSPCSLEPTHPDLCRDRPNKGHGQCATHLSQTITSPSSSPQKTLPSAIRGEPQEAANMS